MKTSKTILVLSIMFALYFGVAAYEEKGLFEMLWSMISFTGIWITGAIWQFNRELDDDADDEVFDTLDNV